jgi:hypothetical protein
MQVRCMFHQHNLSLYSISPMISIAHGEWRQREKQIDQMHWVRGWELETMRITKEFVRVGLWWHSFSFSSLVYTQRNSTTFWIRERNSCWRKWVFICIYTFWVRLCSHVNLKDELLTVNLGGKKIFYLEFTRGIFFCLSKLVGYGN